MDDPHGATRVEIELTPNEGSRGRRHKAEPVPSAAPGDMGHDFSREGTETGPASEGQPVAMGEPTSAAAERRKLVVAGVAVAVVALFIGWALGRAGGSTAGEAAQPEATTIDTSPSETPPLAVVPTAAPATVPRTTRPRAPAGPVPTTVPQWETLTVDVDPAAAALALDIVMVGRDGIAEFDTATGELRTLRTGSSTAHQRVVDAGAGWVVVRNLDTGTAQLVSDGGLPVDVPIGDVWSTHFQPATGSFLQVESTYNGMPMTMVEVDHEGTETGIRFDMPGGVWPAAPDPAGGVVVGAPGGTYRVAPDGSQRITTGNLVALSPRVAVFIDCGEDFNDCGMYVADRATGARTEVVPYDPQSGPLNVLDVQSPAYWSNPELMGAISPDDRWVPVMLSNDRQQFALVDLTTGELVPLAANPPSGLWWSPDGRYAIYTQSSRLMLFDIQQRTRTDIAPSGMAIDAFAVQPV